MTFAIPYEEEFTLIGTTDRDFDGDPLNVAATDAEIVYLCEFQRKFAPTDVVWTYSGVRPLYDDGASAAKDATRDYVLTMQGGAGAPAVLSVFGGKITTYRRLAEDALEKIADVLPQARANAGWTSSARLPGGDFPVDGADALAASLRREYPFLTERETRRFVRHYGTETRRILGGSRQRQDLGRAFGGDITEAEVGFLVAHEFARSAEDRLATHQVGASHDDRPDCRARAVDGVAGAAGDRRLHLSGLFRNARDGEASRLSRASRSGAPCCAKVVAPHRPSPDNGQSRPDNT